MVEYFDNCNMECEEKALSPRGKSGKRTKRYTSHKPKKEFYGDERFKNGDYNDSYECRTHGKCLDYEIEDCDGGPMTGSSSTYKIKSKYANKLIDYGDCCGEACCG